MRYLIGILILIPILCFSETAKTVYLNDKTTVRIVVSYRGTVLNFPTKPSKVILGRPASFGIEYVDSDLALSPLVSNAHSNMFVYLSGRRFSFDLVGSIGAGSAVVIIKDSKDSQMRLK